MRKLECQGFPKPGRKTGLISNPPSTHALLDFRPPGGLILVICFLFLSSLQMSMIEFIPALGPQMTSTNLSFARNLTSQWVCSTSLLLQLLGQMYLLGVEQATAYAFSKSLQCHWHFDKLAPADRLSTWERSILLAARNSCITLVETGSMWSDTFEIERQAAEVA